MKSHISFVVVASVILLGFTATCQKHTTEPLPPDSNLTPSEILRVDYKDGGFNVYWSKNNEPGFASYVLLESPGNDNWRAVYSTTNRNDTMHTIPDIPWDIYRYYRINTGDTDGLFAHGPEKRGSSSPRIAFQSNRDGNHEIYIMEIDGSNPINLTNNPAVDAEPEFSPDGSKIIFRSGRDGNDEIYIMDIDGGNLKNLTNDPEHDSQCIFSPDGSKIAFCSIRTGLGRGDIWIIDVDGSNLMNLTNNFLVCLFPRFSPDRSKIVFQGDDINYLYRNIYIINTDGTDFIQLTDSNEDNSPEFSPDGSKIVITSYRDGYGEI